MTLTYKQARRSAAFHYCVYACLHFGHQVQSHRVKDHGSNHCTCKLVWNEIDSYKNATCGACAVCSRRADENYVFCDNFHTNRVTRCIPVNCLRFLLFLSLSCALEQIRMCRRPNDCLAFHWQRPLRQFGAER